MDCDDLPEPSLGDAVIVKVWGRVENRTSPTADPIKRDSTMGTRRSLAQAITPSYGGLESPNYLIFGGYMNKNEKSDEVYIYNTRLPLGSGSKRIKVKHHKYCSGK